MMEGAIPLHMATHSGHSEVMGALIEAGADIDSDAGDGRAPLYLATLNGHEDAPTELLHAKANPLLTMTTTGYPFFPLDKAVYAS